MTRIRFGAWKSRLGAATPVRRYALRVTAATATVAVLAAGYHWVEHTRYYTVTAHFTSTSGLYVGDEVRVVGVRVGTIESIEPNGTTLTVRMKVPTSLRLPDNVEAIVMAQSLVAARFVQLTPAWTSGSGTTHALDIPVERTAVPVEWDQVEQQLDRLTTALAPTASDSLGPGGRFLGSAAAALDGNGDSLRASLSALSTTMSTLSGGSDDLFATIRNLQAFTTALAASDQQIVVFQGRLAAVTGALDSNHVQLSTALGDLGTAIGDIQNFVAQHRDSLTTQVKQLSDATTLLAQQRDSLELILHRAPTALANYYNSYNPAQGAMVGVLGPQNFGNPINFICGGISALKNATSDQGAQLCAQYLGPLLNTLRMNYPQVDINPTLGTGAGPGQVIFSPPDLQQMLLPGQP